MNNGDEELTMSWSMLRPSDLIPFQIDLSSSYSSFSCPPRGLLRADIFKVSAPPKLLLPDRHARLTASKLGRQRASAVVGAEVSEPRVLSTKRLEGE